jgi:hypothetical protein
MEHTILKGYTQNNETILYMKQSQTRFHEVIQDLMQKMRQVLAKQQRDLEKNCLQNTSSETQATTISTLVNYPPTYFEDFACLEACYLCVDDNSSASVSLLSN